MVRPNFERLAHEADDVGLRDSLTEADRDGMISVGLAAHRLRHEEMTRHSFNGGEHAGSRIPRDLICSATICGAPPDDSLAATPGTETCTWFLM